MSGAHLTRRGLALAAGAGLLAGACTGHAAEAALPAPFAGAVMRTPVIVPQTAADIADVHRRNAEAMVAAIDGLMKGPGPKPRLIVFPVLQMVSGRRGGNGIPMSAVAVDLTAAPLDQGLFAPVVAACRRHDCYVATSTQEKSDRLPGRYFHTGFIMGPDGLVLRSPKSQAKSAAEVSYLRDMADEYVRAFGPDSILPVVKTPIGTLGCYIEAEAEVMEAAQLMVAKGAQILVHPSLENDDTPWLAIKQTIGFECQAFLLTGATSRYLDRADPTGGWCRGAATIIGPDGQVIASMGGHDEGAAVGVIDLAAIDKARAKNAGRTAPAWGLYRGLVDGAKP